MYQDWHGLSPDPKVHQCDVPDVSLPTGKCQSGSFQKLYRGTLLWGPSNRDPTISGMDIRVPYFSETPKLALKESYG